MLLHRLSDVHKGLGLPNSQASPTGKGAGISSPVSHPKFRLTLVRAKSTSTSAVTKHNSKVFLCHSIT